MKVTAYTVDGGEVAIRAMPDADAFDLVEDWREGDSPTITLALDGVAVCHVARAHIVRIDVDEEDVASGPSGLGGEKSE